MDEAREREILQEHLWGTPTEGDEGQMRRLFELDLIDRVRAVAIIAGGEADTVDEAIADVHRRGFYRSLMADLDAL